MRCWICDKEMGDPRLDTRDDKIKPCFECEAIIIDAAYPRDLDTVDLDLTTGEYHAESSRNVECDSEFNPW